MNTTFTTMSASTAPQILKKPVSEARIEANRANAQKSTGPKTPEGKAASSRNATTHGLTAEHMVLPNESVAEFEGFRAEILEALQPCGPLEEHFAERAVVAAWRLNRATKAETEALRQGLDRQWRSTHMFALNLGKPIESKPGVNESTATALLDLIAKRDTLSKLSRYESAIERSLHRAHHELQRLQAARAGKDVPPPVAVDVDVAVLHEAPAEPWPVRANVETRRPPVDIDSEIEKL